MRSLADEIQSTLDDKYNCQRLEDASDHFVFIFLYITSTIKNSILDFRIPTYKSVEIKPC